MSVYRYFRRYVEYGVIPAKRAEDCTLVPENSFYNPSCGLEVSEKDREIG